MKLVTSIRHISRIDQGAFTRTYQKDTLANWKYEQKQPFLLSILANQKHEELVVEFSGKVLLDAYPDLINKTNIRKCFEHINNLGVCVLDAEAIMGESKVIKCDITKDIAYPDVQGVISDIKLNMKNYKKWVAKEYRGGLAIEKVVSTPRYKKRLTVYDKHKELGKGNNADFLKSLKDRDALLEYFQDKTRFELNVNTKALICNLLNIPDTDLKKVLDADTNPIVEILDEAVNNVAPKMGKLSLRDYERCLLIEKCKYDMARVEAIVRDKISSTTSITRAMQPYKELYRQKLTALTPAHSDWRTLLL